MYKKAICITCLCVLILPCYLFSAEPDPEDIEKAVLTEQDEYGVPSGLYHLDQALVRYKLEFEQKKTSNRNLMLSSILVAGCGGLLMAIGDGYELTYAGIRTGIPLPVFGGVCLGGGALGFIVSAVGSGGVREAEEAFTGYYHTTYKPYLEDE